MNANKIWKKVALYYLVAITLTWIGSFLIIDGLLDSKIHYLLGYGPAIAGIMLIYSNRKDFADVKNRLLKIPNLAVFFLLGLSPIWITAIIYLVLLVLGISTPSFSSLGEISFFGNIGLWTLPLWLITFGIGEEIGWRGFLLPLLQNKYSIFISTIIVWLLWLLWHLPFFFYLPTYMNMGAGEIVGFAFSLLSGAILLSWLYQYSGKSVLTTAIWHGLFNFVTATAFGSGNIAFMFSMIVIFVSVIIVVGWLKPKRELLAS